MMLRDQMVNGDSRVCDARADVVLVGSPGLFRQFLEAWLASAWGDARLHVFDGVDALPSPRRPCSPLFLLLVLEGNGMSLEMLRSQVKRARQWTNQAPVILMTAQVSVEEALSAVSAGARGVLPMSLEPQDAARAIAFVLEGGTYLPSFPASAPPRAPDGLTPRERQVAERIEAGMPNKIIAHELQISEATVKVFVRRILAKFGVSNRTQIASRLHEDEGHPGDG